MNITQRRVRIDISLGLVFGFCRLRKILCDLRNIQGLRYGLPL